MIKRSKFKKMKQYIIIISFNEKEEFFKKVQTLSEQIEQITGKKMKKNLPFHVTLCRFSEDTFSSIGCVIGDIIDGIEIIAEGSKKTRLTINSICFFDEKYIVLPVQVNKILASLWVGLNGFSDDPDSDHVLHITVANDTEEVSLELKESIMDIKIPVLTIPVTNIELWEKERSKAPWEKVREFKLSS